MRISILLAAMTGFLLIAVPPVAAQQEWIKYGGNPVFTPADPGSWEDHDVGVPSVIHDGSEYLMYYAGTLSNGRSHIGLATSPDGVTWERYSEDPVLPWTDGEWDSMDQSMPVVIFDGSLYKMWYGGIAFWMGHMDVGLATSTDGRNWTKDPGNPVLLHGSSGEWDAFRIQPCDVVFDGSVYHMWYWGVSSSLISKIGYATSTDGVTWTKSSSNPVVDVGGSGDWDGHDVWTPSVVWNGSLFEMWYSGRSGPSGSPVYIGYATSTDGATWTKYGPVLGIGPNEWEPEVLREGSLYKMWYHGIEPQIGIHYATSLGAPLTVTLSGEVISDCQGPLQGVTVDLLLDASDPEGEFLTTVTDGSGHYDFMDLPAVRGANPVAYWPFDEGVGSVAEDVSGDNHTGTLVNSASWAVGQVGSALDLDGAAAYVSVPDGPGLDGMTKLTVEAWLYLRSYPVSDRGVNIIAKWGPGSPSDDSYQFGIQGELLPDGYRRRIYFQTSDGRGLPLDAHSSQRFSSEDVPINQWVHLMATWETPGDMHIYFDGVEKSGIYCPCTGQQTLQVQDTSQELWIGRNEQGHVLDAIIDEVKIYDDVLTPGAAVGEGEISTVVPLGFESVSPEDGHAPVLLDQDRTVDFTLRCLEPIGEARSMGYWKHQANVYLRGRGHAHESQEDMETNFPEAIFSHFYENALNGIAVENVTFLDQSGTQVPMTLTAIQSTLTVNRGGTILNRAKQQYLALLLNLASGKILSFTVISDDGATVSQAVQHIAALILDGDPTNDELAKEIGDAINNAELLDPGVVPLDIPNIAYARVPSRVAEMPLRVSPNPGWHGNYAFSFTMLAEGPVSLRIYNIAGREVATPLAQTLGRGNRNIQWDGRTAVGRILSRGVYFARLTTPSRVQTVKFVHLGR